MQRPCPIACDPHSVGGAAAGRKAREEAAATAEKRAPEEKQTAAAARKAREEAQAAAEKRAVEKLLPVCESMCLLSFELSVN